MSCRAIVALLHDPRGRPAGFPLWPFSNGMTSLSFDIGTNAQRRAHAVFDSLGAARGHEKTRRGVPPGLHSSNATLDDR
jgi:hypothetical protein